MKYVVEQYDDLTNQWVVIDTKDADHPDAALMALEFYAKEIHMDPFQAYRITNVSTEGTHVMCSHFWGELR